MLNYNIHIYGRIWYGRILRIFGRKVVAFVYYILRVMTANRQLMSYQGQVKSALLIQTAFTRIPELYIM